MKDLKELSEKLSREQIDFKINSVKTDRKGNVKATILAYKDARTDMERLDAVVGSMSWQNKYERDSQGVLQCGIGIFSSDLKQWIWKWSNGVPSAYDKEKGEYSDAFKRAGFMWGIGRALYDFPSLTAILNENEYQKKGENVKAYVNVNWWKWEVSKDYKKVIAKSKINGNYIVRIDTGSYAKESKPQEKPELLPNTPKWDAAVKFLSGTGSLPEIQEKYKISEENINLLTSI